MDKIKFIFRQLIDARSNNAISFKEAGQLSLYSAQIYWEYLNQLKETIEAYLKGFPEWKVRIIIKETIVQIEFYHKTVGEIPWTKFEFAVTSELSSINKESFIDLGFYSYSISQLKCSVPDAVQVISIRDMLEKQLELYQHNSTLRESASQVWKSKIIK